MKYWLIKSEPTTFSFDDLLKAKNKTTSWEGVRNYQARNFMRDQFKLGDLCFFYHSNAEPPAIHGLVEVVKEAYPDPFALDKKSKYYDESAAKTQKNPWVMVDVKAIHPYTPPIVREELIKLPQLAKMELLRRGSRLSVQPVTEMEFKTILKLR